MLLVILNLIVLVYFSAGAMASNITVTALGVLSQAAVSAFTLTKDVFHTLQAQHNVCYAEACQYLLCHFCQNVINLPTFLNFKFLINTHFIKAPVNIEILLN